MWIRQETPEDYDKVYHLIRLSFARAEHRDGNEQSLVEHLRKSAAFIPQLSLVAEDASNLIGYVLFTRATVGKEAVLALAPLAVLPAYQGRGVGDALMQAGHEIARKLGYRYCVVLGSETYYPRAGYRPASSYGIYAPFDVPDQNFMALSLTGNWERLCGTMEYAAEFYE